MFFKKLKPLLLPTSLLSAVGISGFLVGKFYARLEPETSRVNVYSGYENIPALPLFSSVSAAEPTLFEMKATKIDSEPLDVKINRTSEIIKYGFPGSDNIRYFQDFILSYDQRNRIAYWVFEHLHKNKLKKNKHIDRSKCEFKEDKSIHSFFRSTNLDYKRSGYDRGHLAAAGNHRLCQEHVDETFYLTNIAPQIGPGFNRDAWNDLEKHVRKLSRIHNNVYVCTGPLFLPRKENDGKKYIKYEVIGSNHVAVPTHFFKVIVLENDNNDFEMESYVMPNQPIEKGTPLDVFQVPPESIERASGLLFFSRISRSKLKRINHKLL